MARKKLQKPVLSNFAVTRGLSPTSGYLYSQMPDGTLAPVRVRRMSLLGTQSQFGVSEDKAGVGNPQEVEVAYLDRDSDTLVVQFGLRVWRDPDTANIETCNLPHVEQSLKEMNDAYAAAGGFGVLGWLYAERIAKAYPLWRNRYGFDRSVHVEIHQERQGRTVLDFGKRPDEDDIAQLGAAIEYGLSGQGIVDIRITMRSTLGKGQEVFPSQKMAMNAKISRLLEQDDEHHAMLHPWKIGNAIRTIDIWHPYVDEVGPIAVETYGTNVRRQEAFRFHERGFYSYLKEVVADEGDILEIKRATSVQALDSIQDAHYFMAVLVRGGVFGMGKREKS